METNQKDLYTTALDMHIETPYVCGWICDSDGRYGWQVVRMKDNAILSMIGAMPNSGQLGVVHAFSQIKAAMFDMGICSRQVTFL